MNRIALLMIVACSANPDVDEAQLEQQDAILEAKPMPLPRGLTATFTRGDDLLLESAQVRSGDYKLYWASASGLRLPGTVRVGDKVPSYAHSLLACAPNGYCGPKRERVVYPLRGMELPAIFDSLSEMAHGLDSLHDCPGIALAASCGDGRCAANETADNCPADCSAYQHASYNYQTLCNQVSATFAPSTVSEVQYIVKNATAAGTRVKVRAAAHSASGIMCTNGEMIDIRGFNHVLGLETFQGVPTVNVEAGVRMVDLGDWLDARGYSLGYTPLGFNGTTVGGTLATGAHGSSAVHNSVLSQRVQSIDIVTADGELRTFTKEDSDTWRALTSHLGLLGVVVSVRLRVEPQFNLHARVTFHDEEALFDGSFGPHFGDVVSGCDWGQVNWFPGHARFMRTCAVETSAPAERGAQNVLLYPPIPRGVKGLSQRLLQASTCDNDNGFSDFLEQVRLSTLFMSPPFEKEGHTTTDVIGPSHRIMSSPLTPEQVGLAQLDWAVTVPEARVDEAMSFIRDLVHANHVRLPLVGMFLRFSKVEDDSLLAHTGAGEGFVAGGYALHVEMPVAVPAGFTQAETDRFMAPYYAYTAELITRFGGRAHWGKNRDFLFPIQRDAHAYGDRVSRFLAVARALDPKGTFSNAFSLQL